MNLGKMMQQAKLMQEQMAQMQEEMAQMQVSGEAGGGMVKATVSGDRVVRSVEIDPSLWAEQDKELVEDLTAAAINAALAAVEEKAKERQKEMLSGLPLPPGFSL